MSMSAHDRQLTANPPDRGRVVGQLVAIADGLGKLAGTLQSRAMADVHREIRDLELLAEDVARTHREVEYARLSGREPRDAQQRHDRSVSDFQSAIERAQLGAKALSLRTPITNQLAERSEERRVG